MVLIVWGMWSVVRVITEIVKRTNRKVVNKNEVNVRVRHPAEDELRWG